MKKTAIIGICLAGLLCHSCTDDLLPSASGEMEDADGIAFGVSVVEQADIIYDYGRTRAAAGKPALDSATITANTFGAHAAEGDNPWGVNVHRMPLPFVGIHPGSASTNKEQLATRAPLSEIAGNDLLFHDSLTIWGCVYDPTTDYHRFLFNQTLLKKVRGWRSSVHWPYDDGQGKYMRFCAISPAFENLDITLVTPPEYRTGTGGTLVPPTFRYNVPENPGEQRDLLFGCAGADPPISVTDGPPGYDGSGTGYYEGQASTEKEQHLGQDDKVIEIPFQHILTAVRFAQGKMPVGVTIKRITLAHIKNQGVYDPDKGKWGNKTGDPLVWSDDLPDEPEAYSSYTIYPNKSITEYEYEENVYIDGDSVLFLMPQTLVAASELQIVLTEGDPAKEHTLKCSLEGDVWSIGYTVTYKVTIGELKGEYYLVLDTGTGDGDVSVPRDGYTDTEMKYSSGSATHETSTGTTSGNFIIHSFRNAKDYSTAASGTNVHQKADWQMTGFSWTGAASSYSPNNRPAWLESITGWTNVSNEVGNSAGYQTPPENGQQTISYTLAAQSYTHQTTHSAVLASNPGVTDFDLSLKQPDGTSSGTSKTTRESANCYIVNATGSYKFPAVYGNSLSGTTVNSYTTPNIFKDHTGADIQYGNIYKQINSYPVQESTATKDGENWKKTFTKITYDKTADGLPTQEILWQDVDGLFTCGSTASKSSTDAFDITETGFGYVEFSVSKAKPGNCVIALKGRRRTVVTERTYSDEECTTQVGEAVISNTLADEAEILWTWHIWMTDEVYPNQATEKQPLADGAVTNDKTDEEAQRKALAKTMDELYPSYYNGSKIVQLQEVGGLSTNKQMLPVNLGWVPDDDEFGLYQPRDTWVEIQLKDDESQKVHFHIHQDAKPEIITGTSTMYQWGRPTALPMVNYISGTARTIYGAGSTSITNSFQEEQVADAASSMGAVIGDAKKLVRNTAYNNFWWSDAPSAPSAHAYWADTKTLYDPCPPGFQLPPSSVFGWMTTSDMESSSIGTEFTTLNMWSGEYGASQGGYFYALKHSSLPVPDADRYKQKFYFPATSYYAPSGSGTPALTTLFVTGDKQHGVCWTGSQGRVVDFNSATPTPSVKLHNDPVVNLHAVRPVSTSTE